MQGARGFLQQPVFLIGHELCVNTPPQSPHMPPAWLIMSDSHPTGTEDLPPFLVIHCLKFKLLNFFLLER